MKKIILTFICIGLSHSFYAQQERDFTFFNHRIDSLASFYAVEQWKGMSYGNYFDNSNLNDKEKKKLIDKIRKLFEQQEYANLYHWGHLILSHMWRMYPDNNSLEIKQMLIELYLQYYFYPGTQQIFVDYELGSQLYYTKKAKQRIVEILEGKKTLAEYNACLIDCKSWYSNDKYIWEDAARIMKKQEVQNTEVLKQIRDSLLTDFINRCAKETIESLKIDDNLVRIIGLLDMKECIPALRKNLENCIGNRDTCDFGTCRCRQDDIKAYRYALARLGDREQRQYILDNLMDIDYSEDGYFNKRNFAYFRDDEMIWKYIDVNYSFKRSIPFDSEGTIPTALKTMSDIYPFIKNVSEGLNYPYLSNDINDDYKWAKSLYEWLMVNKNNVEFDYDGEKHFPWR